MKSHLAPILLATFLSTAACTAPSMHQHHTLDYLEFTVHDIEQAKRFYGQAFGWRFNDYGPDYAGIQRASGEGEIGGLRPGEVTPGGPLAILYSSDLAASQRSITEAGGRITVPVFEFPGGRRFHFQDPSGNELAVWSDAP